MKYVFHNAHNYCEFRSWDGRITAAPATYKWLLGKPVPVAVEWFRNLKYEIAISADDS